MIFMGFSIACSRHPSDETITKDIQNKVVTDPETRDSEVSVTAKEGKVTSSGKVKTPIAQQKIEQIAHEEPGAGDVDDQTTVENEEAPFEQATQTVAPAPPPPPVQKPKPQPIIIPAGSVLTIRTGQALGSKTSQTGQTFLATLAQPLSARGRAAALPAGSPVSGSVVTRQKARSKVKASLT
jgi:hypothetical protein